MVLSKYTTLTELWAVSNPKRVEYLYMLPLEQKPAEFASPILFIQWFIKSVRKVTMT